MARMTHSRERGQTLALVAVMLAVLIAMGALAIDLTWLYVARGEMQRSADAAALAGAKAFVESGITTATQDANLQRLARTIGDAYITAMVGVNKVGGTVPNIVGGGGSYDFSRLGNPQVTVTLERTDVPTFFAHIFGRRVATVRATAIAEAYNSSNPPGGAANMPPVAPSCVKPWFIVNIDPNDHGAGPNRPFVQPDGSLVSPTVGPWTGPGTGVIGEPLMLQNGWLSPLPAILTAGYLPAKLGAVSGTCPSCALGDDLAMSAACCDTANTYSCGTTTNMYVDLLSNGLGDTLEGAACLLTGGESGSGTVGQDVIDFSEFQGSHGAEPIEITSGSGPQSGRMVNTSSQIITVPIIDANVVSTVTGQVKVDGFMQVFLQSTLNNGSLQMNVLNISGCGPNVNPALTPITGGGVSPVPVRLIHQ